MTETKSTFDIRISYGCLLVLLTYASAGISSPLIYVTNSTSNTVSVVDVGKKKVITEIPVGTEPFGLAFSPNGTRAYVANVQSGEVSVVDASRHQRIQSIPLGTRLPAWVAVSPDGSYVYVTNEGSNDIAVIAAASDYVVARIPAGGGPAGIVVSPDSRYAYVANEGTHDVSLIDLQREKVINTIPVGFIPQGITMSSDGTRVYVANFGSDSVSVIATASNRVISQIPLSPASAPAEEQGPVGIAISPDGQWIYTGNFKSGTLSAIEVSSGKVHATVPIGPETFGVAVEPSGTRVYVVSGKGRQICVVNPEHSKVSSRINLGNGAFKLAIQPELEFRFKASHLCSLIFLAGLGVLLLQVLKSFSISRRQNLLLLSGMFLLALSLRLTGLNWGIPVYDAETVKAAPGMRVSYHMDEDNFLWNLTRVRPEAFDFYVPDFHWGTLQYYLVEMALLISEGLGLVSRPWRESFSNFHPGEYARLYMAGRAVSAILGSCSVFLAYAIGKKLWGERPGIWASLTLSLLPIHVVNSHYLTSDISMTFFLLLAFYGVLSTLDRPTRGRYLLTGLSFGLAITAKYNAVFLLPVILLSHFLNGANSWSKKAWLYLGMGMGLVIGEPYALVYRKQFWDSLSPYLTMGGLPEGAIPDWFERLALQLNNMVLYGIGLPLVLVLIVGGTQWFFFRTRGLRSSLFDLRSRVRPLTVAAQGSNAQFAISGPNLLWLCLLCFFVSSLFFGHPMIRYTLPVAVFAIFPSSQSLAELSRWAWGRVLATGVILVTGFLSFLQVKILTQEHTVNQAFEWIERHVPPGASLQKGWPEIPVLNPQKYRLTNFYTQNRMVDFKEFFMDEAGHPFFSDYVLLDNLPTLHTPPVFLQTLSQHYCLVAEFKRNPQFWKFSFPEWNAAHDWKYSHPEIRIYRRKQT